MRESKFAALHNNNTEEKKDIQQEFALKIRTIMHRSKKNEKTTEKRRVEKKDK